MRLREAVRLLLAAEGDHSVWQYDRAFGAVTGDVRNSQEFVVALKVLRTTFQRGTSREGRSPGQGGAT